MDCCYSDGRILGSMCTEAHPIAKEAFYKFSDSNLGDPGLFKGTKLIEDEVLKLIGSFLSIENPVGHIVTGGTEANLMAMRAARNIARDKYGIENGEIIVPTEEDMKAFTDTVTEELAKDGKVQLVMDKAIADSESFSCTDGTPFGFIRHLLNVPDDLAQLVNQFLSGLLNISLELVPLLCVGLQAMRIVRVRQPV